jgi:pyruvate-ferredoxin/flavodoxin oxidoreductase
MAAIAHAATLRARVPFLHFFDGFRTSHEESSLIRIEDDVLRKLISEKDLLDYRARGMSPDRPTVRGTAQNPDVFFQSREAANGLYDATPGIVSDVMDEFAKLTGREYGLVEYYGPADAENIIVAMGSAVDTIKETLDFMQIERGACLPPREGDMAPSKNKTALIAIHLYRPFPVQAFLSALPKSVKNIAVLDRTKEPGAIGEPLYQDVVAALAQQGEIK